MSWTSDRCVQQHTLLLEVVGEADANNSSRLSVSRRWLA